MDGIPNISLLSGWAFASVVGMTVVMAVIRGKLVPGLTHDAMTEDRDYYRTQLRELQRDLITNVHAQADLVTEDRLRRGLDTRNQGAT